MDKIGVIGLGYVGLPLAVSFSESFTTIGFDISEKRIEELKSFKDTTNEIEETLLRESLSQNLSVTNQIDHLGQCNIYIVTVPTPINKDKTPDLTPLKIASEHLSNILKSGDIVIYESTVYPGVTEEICVPILEKNSKLKLNKDFSVGYSPERINPGDKEHTFKKIKKVVSGSNPIALKKISELYNTVVNAGIYQAESIKVAEAAKVIENTQRDINIAFINELAVIFNKMGIDIHQVLNAAGTKWNFLNFKPGIVGGHCIGVDPYYLAHKAKEFDINPEMILAGRRINDSMAEHVFNIVLKKALKKNRNLNSMKFLIYGLTFKENCPDFRNSQSNKVYKEFKNLGLDVSVYDPFNGGELQGYENSDIITNLDNKKFDSILILVPHNDLKNENIEKNLTPEGFIFDLKNTTLLRGNVEIITL